MSKYSLRVSSTQFDVFFVIQAALVERQRQHQEFLGSYRALIAADRQMRAQHVANLWAWLARQAPHVRQADGGEREGMLNLILPIIQNAPL